jgi:hypothetical protein
MPITFSITAISGSNPDIAVNYYEKTFIYLILIGIFYPSGEPILLHLLRCGPFAVANHSFMGRRLASVATSTREQSK